MSTTPADGPVLEVSGLSKSFGGNHAVREVSFALGASELLALIGPNGAGKTTCFNMLNGQLRPDRGRVVFCGRDITGMRPREAWRLGLGRTFQITATFPSMTVIENVQIALISHERKSYELFSAARRQGRAEAEALLDRVGMAGAADRHCAELAYGDLKRLELAVALANRPRLLLMDEPTAGMAPAARVELMALAARIVAEEGVSILFTEHDMDVVFRHAHRILVLNRGEIIAEGSAEAIRADARVREVYLGGGTQEPGAEEARPHA
ncbi:ABC transporter ATP-binding protein [Paralimibaculum aggregatum]|uniref:ABC transporter ATP-binding protein n=1 Tax=Paralimibaculum aggregatum TaxID=3036245 RepID=A0ABQ6LM88_9RHOB|nr:ABC transporter ATP-binding protein [Limibaculum sp. NKW23]GMG84316.1 ABC transporter ATP-binding protein [Limibaculum sp. NKW23]